MQKTVKKNNKKTNLKLKTREKKHSSINFGACPSRSWPKAGVASLSQGQTITPTQTGHLQVPNKPSNAGVGKLWLGGHMQPVKLFNLTHHT